MSRISQVELLYLAKEYERDSQKFSVLKKSLKRCSKQNQKQEEITPEQSNNSDHLSVHGPSKNTGLCIMKQNTEGFELSEDSTLGKTIPDIAQEFFELFGETIHN